MAKSIYVNARFLTQRISGVQRFSIEIAKKLKELNPEIVFLSPRDVLDERLAEYLNVVQFGKFKGHFWEQILLPLFLMRRKNYLLVNLTNTGPLLSRNHIATVHDLSFYHHPEWFSTVVRVIYKFIIPRFAKKARHVLTVSNFSKKELSDYLKIAEQRITVVPNAVSLQDSSEMDDQFSERKYILAVGSLDPRKNLIRLIDAFEQLEIEGLELFLIGDKKSVFNDPGVANLIEGNSRIHFTGYLTDDELVNVYKRAMVFVYPTIYEGFGIPPLEAMSFKCPVCASRISVLEETCGDAAAFFDPFDSEDIRKTIYSVISDRELRMKLIDNGTKWVGRFSWSYSAQLVNEQIIKLN